MTERPGRRDLLALGVLCLAALGAPFLPAPKVHPSWGNLFADTGATREVQRRLAAEFDAGEVFALVLRGDAPAPRQGAETLGERLGAWDELSAVVAPRPAFAPPGTVAADGGSAAVYLIARPGVSAGEAARRLVERLRALERPPGVSLVVAGSLAEEVAVAEVVERDMRRIVPLVFLALVVTAGWLLRSLRCAVSLALVLAVVLVLTLEGFALAF
jgi:hypothetical protein